MSGPPGAGKTTIAVPLASALGFPLLSKDHIKEALWDALDSPSGDRKWSRQVGGAAMEVLWELARHCPAVVLEANFRPHSALEQERLRGLAGQVVEVYCRCSPKTAAQRYAARAAHRHPAHVLTELPPGFFRQFDEPMGVGTVIDVDAETPVDLEALVRRVREALVSSTPSPK